MTLKNLWIFTEKFTAKPYFFKWKDTTLESANPFAKGKQKK